MNKDRAANYIAQGLPQSQVAGIMGCSPGYISQLMKDEGFLLLVEGKKELQSGDAAGEEDSLQMKALGLQHALMKSISENVGNAEFRDQVKALDIVSNVADRIAQRKNPILKQVGGGTQVTVQLMLPAHAVPQQPVIELNKNSEVVSIDHKPMAPMSSDAVTKLFRQKKVEEKVKVFLDEKAALTKVEI